MMHDKLTLLLTLKGRAEFTFRWLDYMERVRCPYRILISDGGADPEVEERLSSGREYTGLRYTYLRFPYDATHTEFYNKLSASARQVETPYVFLADNDDFLLLDALEQAVAFLDGNPGYSSYGGPPLLLTIRNKRAQEPKDLLWGQSVILGMGPQGPNFEHQHPGDRVRMSLTQHFFLGYYWYNVHRTKTIQRFLDELASIDFEKIIFAEYLLLAVLANDGMIRHDALPFYVRQLGTSMGAGNSGLGADNLLLMSLYPFWGKDVGAFIAKACALVGERPEKAGDDFRAGLATMLSQTYEYSLRPVPAYRRLADRLGLRQTAPWKLLRKAFLALQAAARYYDVFWRKRAETNRIIAANPEVSEVLRFLSQMPSLRRTRLVAPGTTNSSAPAEGETL